MADHLVTETDEPIWVTRATDLQERPGRTVAELSLERGLPFVL